MATFLDALICLYPMEPELFKKYGLRAKCVGHPIVESNIDEGRGERFRKDNDIPEEAKTLGVYFGSRESEFKNISPDLKESAVLVSEVMEDVRIIVPTLPSLEYDVQNLLKDFPLPAHVSSNELVKWDAFKACDVAIAVSGTVALQLAYAGVPHVLAYKMNPITYMILRLMVKVKYAHLVNILLDEAVVPEFIQGKCNPEKIANEVFELYNNEDKRAAQMEKFKKIRKILGCEEEKKPSLKAAEFVLETLGKTSPKSSA